MPFVDFGLEDKQVRSMLWQPGKMKIHHIGDLIRVAFLRPGPPLFDDQGFRCLDGKRHDTYLTGMVGEFLLEQQEPSCWTFRTDIASLLLIRAVEVGAE
jgi:hypothetical protein